MRHLMQATGLRLLDWAQSLGLMVVALATLVAIAIEINVMIEQHNVRLADLLLLFIYLEVLAMVAIYLESGKLPIRIPLYIAIVALARYLILDMKAMDSERLLAVGITTFVLGATVLLIRFGHSRFPYRFEDEDRA